MHEIVEYIVDEYELQGGFERKRATVTIPKSRIVRDGFEVDVVIRKIRANPSIFDEGLVEKRQLIQIPSINKTMIE